MKDYRKLVVWQKAHDCTLAVYKQTNTFPKEEIFSLVNQMKRCAISVPSNIAEGCGRNSEPELKRFFVIAHGSATELSYQLLLAKDLGYLSPDDYIPLNDNVTEIMKMLHAFIRKL